MKSNQLISKFLNLTFSLFMIVVMAGCGGSGNEEVDVTPPAITLNGESTLSLAQGDTYAELGATAVDDFDGDLAVTIIGAVDTNTVGDYIITYTATDSSNNPASINRNISVTPPLSRVVFDPENGKLSVPNDLLFLGSTDGTLEMPDEVAARVDGGTPNYADLDVAMGVLDGWSTQNSFVLDLEFPEGYSLDNSSAGTSGAVRIFEVKMGGEPGCETVPHGSACAPVAELTFGVDFVSSASGDSVVVSPLKPLKPKTTYIVALTTGLKDVDASGNNRSIGGSATYELVRQNITSNPLDTPSLLVLQGMINSFENILSQGFGVVAESLIFTSAMTTQSVGEVLSTTKTMLATNLSLNPAVVPFVDVAFSGQTVADKLVDLGLMSPAAPSLPAFSAALVYQGNVTLPYYLGVPTATNPLAPVNTPWKAACDSSLMVSAYAAEVGDNYPYNPATTAPLSANDGMCIALSSGQLRDLTNTDTGFVLDKERHLTQFNQIPKINALQNIDVQMTLPEINTVNFIRVNVLGMEPIATPDEGWPVVILQHGFTSRKEDMLLLTANLALAGFASVGIDLPLYNSRGFDLNGDGNDNINASSVSPTHFLNLGNLPVTRDNLRQSAADMLGLRFALNFTQGAELDTSKVYILGLSLGAMTSSPFLAIANTNNLDASLGQPELDSLFDVNAAVLASSGGGIANLLVESASFGPLIQGSILSAAGTELSDEFNTILATPLGECLSYLASPDAYVSCQIKAFLLDLEQNGETAKPAEFRRLVAQFVFVAQSVTDAADPSNYGSILTATGTPLLLTEVIGDGMENLSDQVVPNQTVNTPIGGTEPLIRALGLSGKAISSSTQGEMVDGVPAQISGVLRFTKGHHSSVINPDVRPEATEAEANARVTQEMQSQAVSYFSSDGRGVIVTDDEFIVGD
jgi:Pla-1/cef family extracellular lipase